MKIAVVEDNQSDAGILQKCLERYSKENKRQFYIHTFSDGLSFINDYKADFDIVFMDVKMSNMNGFEVAKHLREMDERVCLIFVTNMAQYAIKGYEVNALDYILKPLEYDVLADKMKKAEQFLAGKEQGYIIIKTNDNTIKLETSNIIYVEKNRNYLIYHTIGRTADKQYKTRGVLYDVEKQLSPYGFGKCTHGCLVNFKYVTSFKANTVEIEGQVLPLSRRDRKEFVDRLIAFCGGGNHV